MSTEPPAVSPGAKLLLDSAMEFQACRPDDASVNDAFFEAQAEHQVQALIAAGWCPPTTSDATPDTPVDPRAVIDLIRRAQDAADGALPSPIASALVHHMWQLWQGMSTHGKDAAVALAHEVLAFCEHHGGGEGSLRSQASGTPAETGEAQP